jgi:hypothetical protein
MNLRSFRTCLLLVCAMALVQTWPASAQQNSTPAPAQRDGQRDFDFELGAWKIHLKRLLKPLTGSNTWVEFDGTSVTRKVWDGRSQLEEFKTVGTTGPVEGLTLRLYNPESRQWSLYWANRKNAMMGVPTVGEFKNGQGEFFDQETFNGRTILVRYVWSGITPNSAHFEQSFSDDGGNTWEVNWVTDQTRVSGAPAPEITPIALKTTPQPTAAGRDGRRDFDFHIGAWKTHLKRLTRPLTGSTTWVEYEGTTVVRKVWDSDANLVELNVAGPAGQIEGLSLRLYNPESRQWSLNFANSKGGTLTTPTVGEFKNGRGEFYSQETLNGRAILVRFVISDITPNSAQFEQAFSDDGGKTWEVNWVATDTRTKQ